MTDNSLPGKPAPDEPVDAPRGTGARKGKRPLPRRPVKGKMLVKPRPTAGKTSSRAVPGRGARQELGDQVAPRRRVRAEGRYVRFRIRVEEGKTSIVDSHLVNSPLTMPSTLRGQYAYEVTDGTRLLHAESIPDLGVFRSFPNPEGSPEQRGHHAYELSSYDFDARVPAHELVPEALPNIAIVLHRVKQSTPTGALTKEPLGVQFERELREVTRLEGIPYGQLPAALRDRAGRTTGKKRMS